MSDRRWYRRSVIALPVTLLITAAAVSGCSQTTRHDVLTFFFTGVPEPGEAAASETGADTTTAVVKQRKKRKLVSQSPFFVHGPYGAGQCERCHSTTASKAFRTGIAQDAAAVSRAVYIGPRLAFPRGELCVTCHVEKSPEAAKANGLRQHGPATTGWCTSCHSPHKSKRQYMLLKANNVELCTQCHSFNDLQLTMEHKQDPAADCIACHNPHVSKSPFLLKAEYDEWQGFSGL